MLKGSAQAVGVFSIRNPQSAIRNRLAFLNPAFSASSGESKKTRFFGLTRAAEGLPGR
jgi:hypothetical protein